MGSSRKGGSLKNARQARSVSSENRTVNLHGGLAHAGSYAPSPRMACTVDTLSTYLRDNARTLAPPVRSLRMR